MLHSWTDLWKQGYGPLLRERITVRRVDEMVALLTRRRVWPDRESIYRVLAAADRLTSAAMWLVLHMDNARYLDMTGAPLSPPYPNDEALGRIASALLIVQAFTGYLTANVLSGRTRSWAMDSRCCGLAIEAVNTLTGDIAYGSKGSYNKPQADLHRPMVGSAEADTAGSMGDDIENFAIPQYMRMPLCGDSLVAFLGEDASDGQRALESALGRWRAEDCGLVTPIMILNADGPRTRIAVAGSGKEECLDRQLRTCGFDPITIDVNDPATFAWAILESEDRLKRFTSNPNRTYPAPMPYVIAAHPNLRIDDGEPSQLRKLLLAAAHSEGAYRGHFNAAAAELFVPAAEIAAALGVLQTHALQGRPPESRRALVVGESSGRILSSPS